MLVMCACNGDSVLVMCALHIMSYKSELLHE